MDLRDFSNKRICVAVSGGVDSVALLRYLKAREGDFGYALSVVHCEHGIRGEESLADMRFVEGLCKEYGVEFFSFSEDCPARAKREKTSLETAARNFRYDSFASLIKENKADFIALAHHTNDDAETVLFRLARGTSLSGVGGMSALNGHFIRPFLDWTREEILAYAEKNDLSWREDKTNFELDATRNKLRLEILPKLEDAVPGAVKNFVRFSILASEDDALLYELAKEFVEEEYMDGERAIAVTFSEKKPLFTRACLLALKSLGVEKDYTASHLQSAYELQGLQRGATMHLPQGVEVKKEKTRLLFYKKKERVLVERKEEKKFDENGFDGGMYEVSISKTPVKAEGNGFQVLKIDKDKLPQTAVFRFRKEGDFIHRFGGVTKTLKKFFNEKEIPVNERAYLPLIAELEGHEVYAVCGVEISEKIKVTQTSENILYITLKKRV